MLPSQARPPMVELSDLECLDPQLKGLDLLNTNFLQFSFPSCSSICKAESGESGWFILHPFSTILIRRSCTKLSFLSGCGWFHISSNSTGAWSCIVVSHIWTYSNKSQKEFEWDVMRHILPRYSVTHANQNSDYFCVFAYLLSKNSLSLSRIRSFGRFYNKVEEEKRLGEMILSFTPDISVRDCIYTR